MHNGIYPLEEISPRRSQSFLEFALHRMQGSIHSSGIYTFGIQVECTNHDPALKSRPT